MTKAKSRSADEVHTVVRDHYGMVAAGGGGCCAVPSCCAGPSSASLDVGYSAEELANAPDGADLGLGCGNPQAIAALSPGEVVLDLGSGGGLDCFLAAKKVGPRGRAIGVDMTAEMVTKARANAAKARVGNVEFRLGEIEHLPVPDESVDVIMSNCVINLSPEKEQVFREAYRVLRPGGRIAISDVVEIAPMPPALASQVAALTGCIAGATNVDTLHAMIRRAGFDSLRVDVNPRSADFVRDWLPGSGAEKYVASALIEARKPSASC